MHNSRIPRGSKSLVSITTLLILWELLSRSMDNPLFPPFSSVLTLYLDPEFTRILFNNYLITLTRAILGFILGLFMGLSIGFLLSRGRLSEYVQPVATLFFSIPSVAWIPLLIVWIGLHEFELPLASSFICAFPPILYGSINAFRTIDRDQVDVALTLGADPNTVLKKIIIPQSIPKIIPLIKVEAVMVWKTVFVVEMLVLSNGLGYIAYLYASLIEMDKLLAVIILMALNTLVITQVFDHVERLITRKWFGEEKWLK